MNHYTTLGVAKNATTDEIKKAYRKLASQHHPDKGGDKARFQEIQAAYDVLGNVEKRQAYDNPNPFQNTQFNGFANHMDINEIFQNFGFRFGDGATQQKQRQPRRNKDLRITIQVDLPSTLSEQDKTVSIKTTQGSRETVSVRIPKGVTTGNTVKYSGLGDNFFGSLPRGDLYVNVVVAVPDGVELYENEIYQRLPLNVLDAITGKDITITTPFGEMFELAIPAGIQQGNKLRVREKGMALQNGRGNLFLVVDLVVPKNLSPDHIKLLNEVKNSL